MKCCEKNPPPTAVFITFNIIGDTPPDLGERNVFSDSQQLNLHYCIFSEYHVF